MEDITKYISKLQAFSDAEIMGASMQFSHFSISECENLIKGISRYIIDIIVSSKKQNSNSLTYILPLLTMTRFDEVINNLGNMGKLEDVIGISIKPKKGNDYFDELLLGNIKFVKNIKQAGGAKCNDNCDTNEECDNECPTCLNSKCVSDSNLDVPINNDVTAVLRDGSIVKTPNVISNISTHDAIHSVIAGNTNDIGLAIGATTEVFKHTLQASLALPTRLEANTEYYLKTLENDVKRAIDRTKEALTELTEHTEKADKEMKEEFVKIYEAYKFDLMRREFIEKTAGQSAAITAVITSVKFAKIALDVLNVAKQGLLNGVAWTGLSIVKIASGIPFVALLPWHHIDTKCVGSNPVGPMYPNYVSDNSTKIVYDYEYRGMDWGIYNAYNQSVCPWQWGPYRRVSECSEVIAQGSTLICEYYELFDISKIQGYELYITVGFLSAVLSSVFVFYLVKVFTLQTQFISGSNKISDKSYFESFTDSFFKTPLKYALSVTPFALVQIGTPSYERAELILMVKQQKILHNGQLVNLVQYLAEQGTILKATDKYKYLHSNYVEAKEYEKEIRASEREGANKSFGMLMELGGNVAKNIENIHYVTNNTLGKIAGKQQVVESPYLLLDSDRQDVPIEQNKKSNSIAEVIPKSNEQLKEEEEERLLAELLEKRNKRKQIENKGGKQNKSKKNKKSKKTKKQLKNNNKNKNTRRN